MKFNLYILLFFFIGLSPLTQAATVYNLEQCKNIAISNNSSAIEAQASIETYRARLKEVQSLYYPKLTVLSYVTPMFTVKGNAFAPDVERHYDLGSWGPSTHLEALLTLPFYSFGRKEAGESAAKARLEVEQARLREAQNLVKVEVSKFYYTHLYAKTMLPHLLETRNTLEEVIEKANTFYNSATGKVTKADLMRLEIAQAEVNKYILLAEESAPLALAALKHTMGLEENIQIELAQTDLERPELAELAPFEDMQELAIANRPEWEQLRAGKKAVQDLTAAESMSNRPVLFFAGTLEGDWTPTRDDSKNPYHYDPYNELFAGVAVGLKLDLDPALRRAKIDAAKAQQLEVNALTQKAVTGIPVQIMNARSNITRTQAQIKMAEKARKSANKWVLFSSAAFMSGTGEVKEVLEGFAASLMAKRDFYENILNFHIAIAELDYALGR